MGKLVSFCIKHRVTTIMACVLILIFGIMGFNSLPLALMPNIELPMAIVYCVYPNAGPQEVESMVTRPLEEACASVSGMEELMSTSQENMAMVMVSFAEGTNLDNALVDLREKIDQVKPYLPEDANAPSVMKLDVDALPVSMIALRGADLATLQAIAEDTVSPALERINGVASVDISGGYSNEIAVETYSDKLAGYHLSVSYIAQILGADNLSIPAGDVQNGHQTLTVRTDGEYDSVDALANSLIPLPTGGSVRLNEIADVYIKHQEQDAIAKFDGEPCVILSVNKQSDVNTVVVGNKINAAMEELSAENPSLNWMTAFDQCDFINLVVNSTVQNIIIGVVLAAAVLFVFLRDWGSTAVISVSMPLCIVAVFLVMQWFDITMNMMSLGGIAMGVGMIVDNSIVVLENIFRFRSEGKSRWESCVDGTAEVALSISASTLTTIAVFLPISLSDGIVGMLFSEFTTTICTLLLTSLIVALTIVPLLSYMLLDRGKRKVQLNNGGLTVTDLRQDKPLMRKYKKLLGYFVEHRGRAVAISGAMIALFIVSIALTGFEMLPEMDQGTVGVTIGLPTGSELEEAEEYGDRVSEIMIETVPEIASMYYTADSGVSLTANLVPQGERSRSASEIADQLRLDLADIAGCEITVSSAGMMDMSAMTGTAISVTLSGDDYDELNETAELLAKRIAEIPDAIDVTTSAAEQVPEVDITIDRENAARYGLTAGAIGSAVRTELTGSTATELRIDGAEITVTVRGDSRYGESIDALQNMPLTTQAGTTVPLGMVAEINEVLAPQAISRQDQSRTITVTGGSASGDAAGMAKSVETVLNDFVLPEGITLDQGGENEEMLEAFGQLGTALAAAIGLVYFVLASQFESFIMPIMIMLILPVGLLGSLIGLPLTGQKISILAFVGVIMLAGIVVNSSIVLIDYIQIRRGRGEDKNTAILNACPLRVRPVLMTTLTTILGLLPMALGIGEGAEMMTGMAVVMITGMVISTIVTLLFTPVYYSLVDSLTEKILAKFRHGDDDGPDDRAPQELPAEEELLPAGV
ncbi:MAG: efflux RND transporter permease subunit [Butyricicoccus sp.]|nr:efflux RND transporter permease subunit [Butyricicoccus sp.]